MAHRPQVARRQRYDRHAVISHEAVWCHKERTAGFAAERVNDRFNLGVAVNGRCDGRNIE